MDQFYVCERFLRRLRELDVFREVDYTNRLHSSPDVVLIPRKTPPPYTDQYEGFMYYYLGLLPVTTYSDCGLYFSPVDRPTEFHDMPWKQTRIRWWFSPFLYLSPQWSSAADANACRNALIFLLANNATNMFQAGKAGGLRLSEQGR